MIVMDTSVLSQMMSQQGSDHVQAWFNAQIAAIAINSGFSIATRNTRDFADLEVKLINPIEFIPQ